MKFNLDNYIKELLSEAKTYNADPADVNVCLKKWNEELRRYGSEQQLTREEVEGAIQNFLSHIVFKNQFQLGFFNEPIYTFGYRQLHAEEENNVFNGLRLTAQILNIRFSQLDRILKNNDAARRNLEAAIRENAPTFSIGKFAKRDEDGNVILKTVNGKNVPAEMEEKFEKTEKGIISKNHIDKAFQLLDPFIEKMKDIKNYSVTEIKFLLNLYDQNINVLEAEQLVGADATLFQDLQPHETKSERVQTELEAGRNLLFTTPDGKTKVYEIFKQTDGLRIGFFLHYVRERLAKLVNEGLVDNDRHESYGGPWCVTQPDASQYISYREGGGATDKSYTYYFIENKELDFFHMSDEEIAQKSPEWRKFSNLKYYIDILCYQPKNMRPENMTRISPVNNGGEHSVTWDFLEEKFPGISGIKSLLTNRPLDMQFEKYKKDTRQVVSENPESSNFIGGQSIPQKESFITGTQIGTHWNRGVITRAETWRSFTPGLKKSYCLLTDENNYLNKFGSPELFNEIKSNPNDYTSFVMNVRYTLNQQNSRKADTFVNDIKMSILRNSFNEKPWRESKTNPNIKLLEKLNTKVFSLYDLNAMDTYESNGVNYDGLYQKIDFFTIKIENEVGDNPMNLFHAEKYGRERNVENEDNFWTIWRLKDGKGSWFLSNNAVQRLIDDEVIKSSDINPKLKIIENPQDIAKYQDIK